jgi:HupE/UreJ protein
VRTRALFLTAFLPCAAALAHDQTTSYSTWKVRGSTVEVTVRLTLLDVSRFPWANADPARVDRMLADYLTERLTMRAGDAPCRLDGAPHPIPGPGDRVAFGWRLQCAGSADLRLRSDVLLDVAPSHLHFARVEIEGQPPLERVLSDGEREWSIHAAAAGIARKGGGANESYLQLGLAHIATGWDHLAFLAALLLAGGSLAATARSIVGFAVAHSLSLALATLGSLSLDSASIAALIGLSIALVAAENLWHAADRALWLPCAITAALAGLALASASGHGRVAPLALAGLALFAACYFTLLGRAPRTAPLRSAFAFLFGLLHGLGFAGALEQSLSDDVGASLLRFNLGIEIGVIAAVGAALLIRRVVETRESRLREAAVDYASAAALMLGTYWFVARAFG